MKGKVMKYVIGFAIFMAYYLLAENIKNKVSVVGKLTNVGAKPAA